MILATKAPTYAAIRSYVRTHFHVEAQTCHIAYSLEKLGFPVRRAVNRKGDGRVKPCSSEMFQFIQEAVRALI